jgi:hypothetical protein
VDEQRVRRAVACARDAAWIAVLLAGMAVWGVSRRLRGERADYWFPGRGARR